MTNKTSSDQSDLVGIVYVSSATSLLTDGEIRDLLAHARKHNAEHGITGLLVYDDGNFIQYVEGEAAKIDQLMTNLSGDRRHKGLIVLERTPIATRAFPEWSMAFDRVPGRGQGASTFLSDGFLDADTESLPAHVKRLLDLFRENIR